MKKSMLLTGIAILAGGAAVLAFAARGGEEPGGPPAGEPRQAEAVGALPEQPPAPPGAARVAESGDAATATNQEADPAAATAEPEFDVANWDPRSEPPSEPFHTDPDGTAYYVVPTKHIRNGKPEKGHAVVVLRPIDEFGNPRSAPPSPK